MTRSGSGWLAWPALVFLALFFLAPLAVVASYSFMVRDVDEGVSHEFSTAAWEKDVASEYTTTILKRTLLLAAGVTFACLLLGYPVALTLARFGVRWRQTAVVLITFPLVTSLLLRLNGWKTLLSVDARGTLWAVILVETVNYLPFMVLPLLRAIERIDANLRQAAMDLGATPWQTFWHVNWPLTRPGMLAGCALVFIPVMGEYLAPRIIGDGKVFVLGTVLLEQFIGEGSKLNWPFASAIALVLTALVLLPAVFIAFRRGPEEVRP